MHISHSRRLPVILMLLPQTASEISSHKPHTEVFFSPTLIAHKKLRISKVNSRYQQGKSGLFATVISLKYLLDATDFRLFYYELKKVSKKYNSSDKTLELL